MVFVTVGSQKFQFNRLLKAVDGCVADGSITDDVYAQIGYCDYIPENYKHDRFMDRDSFSQMLSECRVVITHGGTGVIVNALKQGKKVVAMPRLAKYGEHVDDHQAQLLENFSAAGLILTCSDSRSLKDAYEELCNREFPQFESTNDLFLADLDRFLSGSAC